MPDLKLEPNLVLVRLRSRFSFLPSNLFIVIINCTAQKLFIYLFTYPGSDLVLGGFAVDGSLQLEPNRSGTNPGRKR